MAVIDELGLEVEILVDGSPAAEYEDNEPGFGDEFTQGTVKCHRYVESFDNTEFAIQVGLTSAKKPQQKWIKKKNRVLTFHVTFDGGQSGEGGCITRDHRTDTIEGVTDRTNNTMKKFRFTRVSTVDDADKQRIDEDKKSAKNLGLIKVRVLRGVTRELAGSIPHKDTSESPKKEISLAEKALKGRAVSHGTTFSPSVPIEGRNRRRYISISYEDSRASPLAVFYFKYRSRDALKQEMVIPRSRSHSPKSSSVDDLSQDKLRRLAQERLSQIQGERGSSQGRRTMSIKRENDELPRSNRPIKFVKIEGGHEAIDLTEDD